MERQMGGCEERGRLKGSQQGEKRQCYGAVRSYTDAIQRKDDQGIRRGRQREREHSGQCGWAASGAEYLPAAGAQNSSVACGCCES